MSGLPERGNLGKDFRMMRKIIFFLNRTYTRKEAILIGVFSKIKYEPKNVRLIIACLDEKFECIKTSYKNKYRVDVLPPGLLYEKDKLEMSACRY
jgi:hypothetical protein